MAQGKQPELEFKIRTFVQQGDTTHSVSKAVI